MWRLINIAAIVMTLLLVVATYRIKFETRQMQKRVGVLTAKITTVNNDINILRAEWAYLTRPARIERLARKFLPLRRVSDAQTFSPAAFTRKIPASKAGANHPIIPKSDKNTLSKWLERP